MISPFMELASGILLYLESYKVRLTSNHTTSSSLLSLSNTHIDTMPSFLAALSDPKPYHILTYGTLLGSNLFQTFLAGPVAFKALPRPNFSQLQQAIFPLYFGFQTALPVVLALTWPGERLASAGDAVMRRNAGYRGLLAEENKWIALIPIALMFGTSLANLVWLGPATTKVMKERKHQGMLDMISRVRKGEIEDRLTQ
jgi:hypothetical protein